MSPSAIRQRKLYEDVAERLEQRIAGGDFAPSDPLPSERELMETYGVGRPAVREALFHLQKLGLVELRSGTRARVTRPTPQSVMDGLSVTARHMLSSPDGIQNFQNVRIFFEAGLARHAALHASEEDIADFEAALEDNRATLGDFAAFERTDVAFHYVLALIPRNPIFTAIHAAFAEWLHEQRKTTLAPGVDKISFAAHKAIFEAVAARDPDAAERAMRDHLGYVSRRYALVSEVQ
ncbi:transcriptional regulator NanR [Bauldia litoralis]|uniref:DNA-binding transcriptional regulator, FadR family n=1 Tax=Bauldia litoralis TaxID=665467 RepID=A0A1G6CRG7_9HYPH|nr:transcriptional regulator NanR [Bauldia litoralis]SDB35422.1 DNA-binding transcriptional regulator, FadR family [Bauldia litoralis]